MQNITVKERSILVFVIKNIPVKQAFTISDYNASQNNYKWPCQCLICMEISKVGYARDRENGPCSTCERRYV
jgi:hypothetical protein